MFTISDVSNDIILMLQFLEVVQQHIVGVVGNFYMMFLLEI